MSSRATFACMDWRSPRSQNGLEPPGGEYVVVSGRPFPEKLDRRFRIAASVTGLAAAFAAAALPLMLDAGSIRSIAQAADFGASSIFFGGLAYGAVRAIGMLAVGATALRRGEEQYAVEWQEPPRADGWSREKVVAAALFALFMVLVVIATR